MWSFELKRKVTLILENITTEKLKQLNQKELLELCAEIRHEICKAVAENGGHLASNLGVVELTVALHRVFSSPKDKIVFDVGHQCYAHKMLTGRLKGFEGLRRFGGMSGFPKLKESPHDAFETGHASTALSAALGMARARDLKGSDESIIAVVGDGAFTGGMCYEALNDAGNNKTPLIVILNDNSMSIAKNVGALNNYLSQLRTSHGWVGAKRFISSSVKRIPLIGKRLYNLFSDTKDHIKNLFVRDRFFSSMGFRYLGPIDGHDEVFLEKILSRAKNMQEPVLIHVVTKKGCGYGLAEALPDRWHGTAPFYMENGEPKAKSNSESFASGVSRGMLRLAERDERVVAIVAAMGDSTGMSEFQKKYPKRFFDVGIAEQHAVTLSAGMARNGLRPFVAIYDTFLQRAYDQMIEDVCLQNYPVVFLMDRAGLGGEDGPTHHGVFGLGFIRQMPNIKLFNPRNNIELEQIMEKSLEWACPVAVRYPKAEGELQSKVASRGFIEGRNEILFEGDDLCIMASGSMLDLGIELRERLEGRGCSCELASVTSIKPFDFEHIRSLSEKNKPYFVLEENNYAGGIASMLMEEALKQGFSKPRGSFSLGNDFVEHGNRHLLMNKLGLSPEAICESIIKELK